ncbi:MAG: FHA domain-containing protein [Cyanobacteriota/Melainabacteria group bacterium]
MRNGQLYFKDVSSNGTYINGDRIGPGREVPINLSDEIHLGSPNGPRLRLIKEQRPIEVGPGGLAGDLKEGGYVMIGRDHSGSVPLNHPRYKKVSGNHARLSMKDGQLYVHDVSMNGTYVNGVKIERGKDVPISSADDIRLGSPDGPRLEFRERDKTLLNTRVTRGPIDIEADSLILERSDGGVDAEALERVIRQIKSSNKSEFPKMPVQRPAGTRDPVPGARSYGASSETTSRPGQNRPRMGGNAYRVSLCRRYGRSRWASCQYKDREVHIIDPTGNLQKSQNGRANNVAAMNEQGVVYGPRPIFDQSGTLRYDADPTETVRIDGEEVSLKDQVDRFKADVDSTLLNLTESSSPLTLSDFSGSIRNQPVAEPARLLRDFETMLRERASDPEYADFRQGLIGFADNIRDGALNYASRVGREVPPTEPLKEYLDNYAEKVMLDHALADLKVKDLNVPSNPERSADVRVIKGQDGDASLKLEHENGSIYNIDSINTMLKSAQIRMTNETGLKAMLLSKPFSGKMKALRAKYPNLDDDQIVRKVRDAINNVDYRYGLHLVTKRRTSRGDHAQQAGAAVMPGKEG